MAEVALPSEVEGDAGVLQGVVVEAVAVAQKVPELPLPERGHWKGEEGAVEVVVGAQAAGLTRHGGSSPALCPCDVCAALLPGWSRRTWSRSWDCAPAAGAAGMRLAGLTVVTGNEHRRRATAEEGSASGCETCATAST